MWVASQNLNVPSIDTVAFGLGYMVNIGLREAEGVGMEFCQDIIAELMKIRRNKLPFFQRGMRAMSFILSSF